ncbi:MAG TPA: ubiquitin-like small modifier protein 1 [Terriglobales bacterium]|jgi:adenylyltransferase/sulfurtransferase|nr:ubiquitin-like small modifier protein 1 [Terriglobales bacterium]
MDRLCVPDPNFQLHLLAYHSILIYMPKIQIPSPLRQYSGKQSSVDVTAKTVAEALAGLVAQHPDLKRHLFADDGKLRAFVNVYVNDEDMRYLQKEATALKDGDTISIVPSIAGGCEPQRSKLPFTTHL